MDSDVLCFVVLAFFVLASSGQRTNDEKACARWKSMADQLSHQRTNQMQCYANSTDPCTSLDCTGTYKYMSQLLSGNEGPIEVDYCFGMTLNHCDNPVSIDFYLQVPLEKIEFHQRVSHDTQLQVPGLTFPYEGLGSIDLFLYFHMVRTGNTLTFSIISKLRISSFGTTIWPEHLQRVIVPPREMEVPACSVIEGTSPPHVFKKCNPPRWVQPSTVKTPTTNPVVTPIPKSSTYKKNCTQGTDICGRWEECRTELGVCQCQPDYTFSDGRCTSPTRYATHCKHDSDCAKDFQEICSHERKCTCTEGHKFNSYYQLCKVVWKGGHGEYQPVVKKSTDPSPHSVSVKSPDNTNKIAIIAGSITGGIVLLAVVFVVVFVMRKRRRPYLNRELLLSSNDDTDVIM